MDEEGWDLAGFCSRSQKSEGNQEGEILLRCINVKAELVEVVEAALPRDFKRKFSLAFLFDGVPGGDTWEFLLPDVPAEFRITKSADIYHSVGPCCTQERGGKTVGQKGMLFSLQLSHFFLVSSCKLKGT